jgi:hypothetical protein
MERCKTVLENHESTKYTTNVHNGNNFSLYDELLFLYQEENKLL